jgi:iron complex outermembrane receptor protein
VFRVIGDGTQIGSSITNAGEATFKGFEVELVAQHVQGLQANASVGYLDAEYDEFFDTVPGMPGVLQDRSDEPFFNVPEWSVSAGVQYKFELDGLFDGRDLGSLTPRFDFSYKSKRAYHLTRAGFESGLFKEGSVDLYDARLGWESPNLRYGLAFWIRNLLDENYINGAVDLTDFFGTGATRVGAPRTFGVELTLQYF